MASLTVLLLHLLLLLSSASAWYYSYYGGSLTFTPKGRYSNGIQTFTCYRVPRNCPRTYNMAVYDPDGDKVRCRVPTNPNTNECGLCGLTAGFSFD
ncbi:hypothetical protein FQN60_010708, partial [Etheostoma spectabile]